MGNARVSSFISNFFFSLRAICFHSVPLSSFFVAAFRIENALNAKEKSVLAKITENQMDTVILKRKKILLAWQEDRSFWF